MRASLVAVALVALVSSCTGAPAHGSLPSISAVATSSSPGALPSAQRVTDRDSFTAALEAAGSTVRAGDRAHEGLFSVPGRTVIIDDVPVTTFEYPSEQALDEERSLITPDGYGIPTPNGGLAVVEWIATPHLYSAGRLLVVYVGEGSATLETLELVLGQQFAGG